MWALVINSKKIHHDTLWYPWTMNEILHSHVIFISFCNIKGKIWSVNLPCPWMTWYVAVLDIQEGLQEFFVQWIGLVSRGYVQSLIHVFDVRDWTYDTGGSSTKHLQYLKNIKTISYCWVGIIMTVVLKWRFPFFSNMSSL